jgi:hypothetical protein
VTVSVRELWVMLQSDVTEARRDTQSSLMQYTKLSNKFGEKIFKGRVPLKIFYPIDP